MGKRAANFVGFAACAGLMAYALYAQFGLMLDPCPLCVLQRVAVIGLGLVFLAAAIHHRAGGVYAALIGLAAAAGAAIAGRHVWLQQLPPDEVPACGPGFDYLVQTLPLTEALGAIFKGSGECAEVDWLFLGLSMPAWTLIWILALGAFGIWANLRG